MNGYVSVTKNKRQTEGEKESKERREGGRRRGGQVCGPCVLDPGQSFVTLLKLLA